MKGWDLAAIEAKGGKAVLAAEELRQRCNKMTAQDRDKAFRAGMAAIYGSKAPPSRASRAVLTPDAPDVPPEAPVKTPETGQIRQFTVCQRPRGSTGRWHRTPYRLPEMFAQEQLERIQAGQAVGITAPIVIAPLFDPELTEFRLEERA